MHRFACRSIFAAFLLLAGFALPAQQIALQGLRSQNHAGAFVGLRHDAAGNLYTLLQAADGVRLQKYSADGTQLLGEAHVGQNGDTAVALDLDAAGNVYVTGTSNSLGSLSGTSGTAFPNRTGTRTESFLTRFSPQLQQTWLTFCGAEPMAATGIAVSGSTAYVTGSIFAANLPVTPNGIQQSPATGSNANGFVESFSTNSGSLQYATYLTGANGDTAPTAIAADAAGNTYIVGNTSASGFPTTAALVPVFRSANSGTSSGFVTKLTPGGDGFLFSTFVPGAGLTSVSLDSSGNGSLLFSGDISSGLFPVLRAQVPLASGLAYQTAVRMPLDGSAVISSTVLAPATQSLVTATGDGSAWVAGSVQNTAAVSLLPVPTIETIGNAFAMHVAASGAVDRATRFGGLPVTNSAYASLPAREGGIAVAPGGPVTFVGSIAPTLSSALLSSETYDFSLAFAPSTALPSAIRDALPTADCNGSACSGGAGLLAQLAPNASAASLALSSDDLPNLTVRNLGTGSATGVQITTSGYQLSSGCGDTVAPGSECGLLLIGSGPGSITVQSANSAAFTTQLPTTSNATRPVVVLPREVDFGIVTSQSAVTRTLTITNLSSTTQTFTSQANTSSGTPYTLSQSGTTCTPASSGTGSVLGPRGSCTVTLALQANSGASYDGVVNTTWTIGTAGVSLTGYTQAAAESVSATTIDFGRQFTGGLRSARYLYLSNSSDQPQSHSAVVSTNGAFTVMDGCPSTLQPHSVCQIELQYEALTAPSSDTLSLDVDGASVSVLGETFPQPSATGASTNPNLTVSPTSVAFSNAVPVTEASSETHTVTISNTGNAAFPLSLSATGDFTFNSGCPAALAGNSNCSVTVTFTPTGSGSRQGLLSVTAGSSSPAYVALSGTGTAILSTNTSSLTFADTPLNAPTVQSITVSQSFPSLTVSSSDPNFTVALVENNGYGYSTPAVGDFSKTSSGTCYGCRLYIQFRPLAAGAQAATLTLSSRGGGQPTTLSVSGNGVPLTGLILTPVSQQFGTVPVNSSSGTALATLTNGTAGSITVSGVVTTGDFVTTGESTGAQPCTTGSLQQGAACLVALRFKPSASGSRTGQLQVSTSAGQVTAALSGTGMDDPGVGISPLLVQFDNVPGAAATQQTVTVMNTSSAPITIGNPQATSTQFAATTNCGSLAAGASCGIQVTYTPGTTLSNAMLSIPVTSSPSGIASTQTYMVTLAELYTSDSAWLQIVPGEHASVNYGSAPTGSPSLTRVLHVNNLSQRTLAVQLQTSHQFAVTASTCTTLAAGAGCDLSVQYTPLVASAAMGSLLVEGVPTDGSATQSSLAYLEAYGNGAPSSLAITGALNATGVLDFGQVASGQRITQTLTLTNPVGASATLTVRRVQAEEPYTSTTTCGQPLAPGQSCTVALTFAPVYQVQSGSSPTNAPSFPGSLVVDSDGTTSQQVITLTGTATPAYVSNPDNTLPLASFDVSQGSLTFTSTAVGTASATQAVTMTNTGTAVLHLQQPLTSNGFQATSNCITLTPGSACSITVQYVPQSTTTALGALAIVSDSSKSLEYISLLGNIQASTMPPVQAISLSPTSVSFGRVLVNSSASQLITVTNTGTAQVTLGTRTITGDASFALATSSSGTPCGSAGTVLAAGSSCTIAVTLTPSSTGSLYATLSVASSATSQPLTVPLSATGTQPQLAVSPSSVSFGDVAVGSTSGYALTLVNNGSSAVDGLSFTASTGFSVSNTCGITTLNAGSSCAVNITFAPASGGVVSGVLTIRSTDPASPITVPLSGNGVQATGAANTALTATPSALAFDSVAVGSSSTLSLVLSNPAATTASSLLFTTGNGYSVTSSCGTALNAYSTCSVLVTFSPVSAGLVNGTLTVQSANTTAPLTVALTGTGANVVPQLTATPSFLAFGSVPVGSSSTLSVTLTNSSSSPVSRLTYASSGTFSLSGNCGTTLNSNSSCNLLITFAPTLSGAVAGTLTVASSDPTSPIAIALTGSGAVLPPRLQLTPSTLDFGSQVIGSSSTLTAVLKNSSSSSVSALSVTTTTGFAVLTNCGSTLTAGSSCTITLMFTPSLAGPVSGLLTVTSSDPASPLTASLTGTGTSTSSNSGAGFTLTVNGAASGSATVQAGLPASYALTVTPINGYTGTVTLTCATDSAITYAACSLVPSTVTLAGTPVTATATINTVSAVSISQMTHPLRGRDLLWCLTPAALLLLPRRRRLSVTLLLVLFSALLATTGCGSGGDARIRYVSPGTYTFHVTATSTSGQTIAQSVTLNVIVTPK